MSITLCYCLVLSSDLSVICLVMLSNLYASSVNIDACLLTKYLFCISKSLYELTKTQVIYLLIY